MDATDRVTEGMAAEQREFTAELTPRNADRERQITMLNRKAIVVLAAIAGMTVMVVSFAFNAPKQSPKSGYDATAPAERVGDEGVRQNYLSSPPDTSRMGALAVNGTSGQRQASAPSPAVGTASAGADALDAATSPDVYDAYAGATYVAQPLSRNAAPAESERPSARQLAFERAMRCGIRTCPAESSDLHPVATSADIGLDAALATPEPLPIQPPVSAPGSPASVPQGHHEAFLKSVAGPNTEPYVIAQLQRPVSPYQIMAGTLIPVTLVTAINSDLSGEVVAQVTRNVYDTQQRHLLIPAGSRVLGRVDDQVGLGQARVNIAWHRLILPNNNSLSLPGFAGVDGQGAAGIRDRVNNHYGRTYVNALLLSAITAGAQLSQPQAANIYASPSAGQIAAGTLGQRMGDVSSETIRRNMQVGPTLEVRPGFKFSIYVSQDLVLPPYDRYGDG